MNGIVNNFLLAGDDFVPERHLRQPGFTCRDLLVDHLQKTKDKEFKETGDLRYIYQKEIDKAWFQHDVAYGDFNQNNSF